MRRKQRKRSLHASRLRLIAVVITITFAALVAVLAACFPSAPRPPAQVGPSVSQKPEREPASGTAAEPRQPVARPQAVEPRGRLAVIIDDAGYSLPELEPFLELPGPLTVAVLPNLPHSTEAARMVLAAGKDLILHCPMEAMGGENPGPGALRVGMSEAEIDRQLAADFASVPGAEGMNNHMGSRATADPALMEAVLGYVKRQGLFFVDSRTTAETVAPSIARKLDMPLLSRSFFIDDVRSEKAVADAFTVSVHQAVTRGTAIVIGHVQSRAVLDILRAGQKDLADNGVRLVRLEEIMSETRVAGSGRDRTGARFFEDSWNRELVR
jgi:polysaccharide deacetylase 2 family uncharacterized protein YibQ